MMKLITALLTLVACTTTTASFAESKFDYQTYLKPVKVNSKDSYDYNYMLLLTYENAYSFLFKERHGTSYTDSIYNLVHRCDDIGAILTKKDFIELNKQFATDKELNFELANKVIENHKKEVGGNCKAIYELTKKEAQKQLLKYNYKK